MDQITLRIAQELNKPVQLVQKFTSDTRVAESTASPAF